MNPNDVQCSINCPFNDNAVGYSGPTLPRSFTLVGHGRIGYGVSLTLSIILSPGKSFTLTGHGRQAYEVSSNLSIDHSRDSILDLFSLANVEGISRALIRSMIQVNQTRILFVWDSDWGLFWGLIAAHPSRLKLKVPYTVTTGTFAHG